MFLHTVHSSFMRLSWDIRFNDDDGNSNDDTGYELTVNGHMLIVLYGAGNRI